LWHNFKQVHAQKYKRKPSYINDPDASSYFVRQIAETAKASVWWTVDEHQVKNSVECDSRPKTDSEGHFDWVLVEGYTKSGSDKVGPNRHEIADDIGGATVTDKDLEQHGHANLTHCPSEKYNPHKQGAGVEKEGVAYGPDPKGIEHYKGYNTEQETEQEINCPISGNSEAIHPHHLNNLGLFFQNNVVQENGEQQAQWQRKNDSWDDVD
jgi:hypothetical protein